MLLSVVCEPPLEVAWLPWLRYDLGEGVSLIVIGEVAYLPTVVKLSYPSHWVDYSKSSSWVSTVGSAYENQREFNNEPS